MPIFKRNRLKHIKRYREIVAILAKYGLADILLHSRWDKRLYISEIKSSKKRKTPLLPRWRRIRLALEELGPTFIKLGQILSNRPDLLPPELLQELALLQDAVPPFPADEAQDLIQTEFGVPLHTIFQEFDAQPQASASIAQVHRALLADGREVAVKVQRPGIEKAFQVDLEIMEHIVRLLESYVDGVHLLNPSGILSEFRRVVYLELDFLQEKTNIERFQKNFENDERILVPGIVPELCTSKVLTMAMIRGTRLADILDNQDGQYDKKVIAENGAKLMLIQIFEHGFFHGDPHPGNLMVMPGNVICFLDFGIMGIVTPRQKELFADAIIHVVNKDYKKLVRVVLSLTQNVIQDQEDELESDVAGLVEYYYHLKVKDIRLQDATSQVLNLLLKYNLKMYPNLYLIVKTLITLESVASRLDPDFDLVEFTKPFTVKLMKDRMSLSNIMRNIKLTALEYSYLMKELPGDLKDIAELVKQGKVRVDLEEKSLKPFQESLYKISTNLTFSVILASLIVGSSLIVLSRIPPLWNGIPIIGIAGFLASGIMGFSILIIIIKNHMF